MQQTLHTWLLGHCTFVALENIHISFVHIDTNTTSVLLLNIINDNHVDHRFRDFIKGWVLRKLTSCEDNFVHLVKPSEANFIYQRSSLKIILPVSVLNLLPSY